LESPGGSCWLKILYSLAFESHQIKPEDPRFIYDKRVEFPATQVKPSEWDEEGEPVIEEEIVEDDFIPEEEIVF
jgi:hypothetical protein